MQAGSRTGTLPVTGEFVSGKQRAKCPFYSFALLSPNWILQATSYINRSLDMGEFEWSRPEKKSICRHSRYCLLLYLARLSWGLRMRRRIPGGIIAVLSRLALFPQALSSGAVIDKQGENFSV